jgi:hypothetical protein
MSANLQSRCDRIHRPSLPFVQPCATPKRHDQPPGSSVIIGRWDGVNSMNFVNMPELHWHYGYFATIAGMAVIALGLFALFKRINWL